MFLWILSLHILIVQCNRHQHLVKAKHQEGNVVLLNPSKSHSNCFRQQPYFLGATYVPEKENAKLLYH